MDPCKQYIAAGRRKRWPWAVAVAALLAALVIMPTAAQAQASVTASFARNPITLGEPAELDITISGGSLQEDPVFPDIAGLTDAGHSTSTQMIFGGTQLTSKTTFSFDIQAAREGSYRIPGIPVLVDGQRLLTQPLVLRVTKANLPPSPDQLGFAFVQISVPTNFVYIGEMFPLEIRCYCQAAANVQTPEITTDGFTTGNMTGFNGRPPQVAVGGKMYNLLTYHLPVSPTKSGLIALGPANWTLSQIRGYDFFGSAVAGATVTVSSDPLQMHVLPIPTNDVPQNFTGAVGQFSLAQLEAGPTTVAVGDPITLKIRIAGRGSFDRVKVSADLLGWRDFKTYPPTMQEDFSSDPMQIEGSKYFEQVITPLNAGVKEIPAFAFSYFDPEAHSFRTLSHAPIPLSVQAGAAAPQPTLAPAPAADNPPPAQEIVNIKEWPGTLSLVGPPWVMRPGFWVWQLTPPLAWVAALLWRRQKDRLANDPRLRRRREVARIVQKGLAELPALATAQNADGFFALMFRLLREQFGERLDLPASAITEAVLDTAESGGLDPATMATLRELFQACNQYHYTPDHTAQEMASLIPKLRSALEALQAMPSSAKEKPRTNPVAALGALALLLFAPHARGDTLASEFDQGNKFYAEEQYSSAAAIYQKMIDNGEVSPAVYFNLGNAYFKAGQAGRAIAAYRRAEELAPRDPDIRANLQFARNQAGAAPPALPGSRWTQWVTRLTLNEWTTLASVFLTLFFLVLTARQIWPAIRKSGSGYVAALGLVCVWWVACLALAFYARDGAQSSVVVVPETVARNGPLAEASSAFTAHDGAELLVLDRKDNWLQVTDAAHHVGWVPQKDVALVP